MPDEEQLERSPTQPDEEWCPVVMSDDQRCRRLIHRPDSAVDERPVCLMHSKDPNKSDEEFQREFECIVGKARKGTADFTEFVFFRADYKDRKFNAACVFRRATFKRRANFVKAHFDQKVDFEEAEFCESASFVHTEFHELAEFGGAKFKDVGFLYAVFGIDSYFSEARFKGEANFGGATFNGKVSFALAEFGGAAVFVRAKFVDDASFDRARMKRKADFASARFQRLADFRSAVFEDEVQFRETEFRRDTTWEPGPRFDLARFEKPERAVFYKTYLGQALFYTCEVAAVSFSIVEWRRREGSGKRMLFEEDVDLARAHDLAPAARDDKRNYSLIAETYQQLKKNYDDRRDYWTAGDWHYGEMEMKRLSSPRQNKFLRWWHRNLGLVGLYRIASEYGESYTRPLGLLAVAVLLFGLVAYPTIGLRYSTAHSQGPDAAVRWWDRCPEPASYHTCMGYSRLAGNTLLTSVEVAAFQRDLAYEPAYPWGRLARLVELVLTSTLLALFLLALRRQFRR